METQFHNRSGFGELAVHIAKTTACHPLLVRGSSAKKQNIPADCGLLTQCRNSGHSRPAIAGVQPIKLPVP